MQVPGINDVLKGIAIVISALGVSYGVTRGVKGFRTQVPRSQNNDDIDKAA